MKFLFYIEGSPIVQGHTRWQFKWSPAHAVYLWEGRETELKDFDAVSKEAFSPKYHNMFPRVKLAAGSVAPAVQPVAPPPPTGPVEITVADALEVIEKFAPHRLKAKPGPKVQQPAAA